MISFTMSQSFSFGRFTTASFQKKDLGARPAREFD